jgi:hypothetical protein
VEELKADAVIAARTGEGVFWQSVASLAPDGSKLERWAEGKSDETIQANLRTEREVEAAVQATKQDAAHDAAAIRGAAANVCVEWGKIAVVGNKVQQDVVTGSTTFVDSTLDGAGNRVKSATDYAPAAGAVAGGTMAAKAYLSPMVPTNTPTLAELARTAPELFKNIGPASTEATERHLMPATVLPSVQLTTDTMEAEAKQWLNTHQRAPDITDRGHPGHARYQQALDAIERSPNIPPGTFTGERLQQAAANLAHISLTGTARPPPPPGQDEGNGRLDRIDFVVFNRDRSGLIAGQGEIGNPAGKLAFLPAAQDNATTLTQASQQVQDTMAQQQQQAQQLAQQPPTQTQDDPAPKGPKL